MTKNQNHQVHSLLLIATLLFGSMTVAEHAPADEPSRLDGSKLALDKTEAQTKTLFKSATRKTVQPLTVHPGLAKARSRSHRVIELSFNVLHGDSPAVESEPSIAVQTQAEGLTRLKLETSKFFYLADELQASRVDGSVLSADNLLDAVANERVVVVTHIGNSLPKHYLAALASRAIIIRVPHTPRVQVSAAQFGEQETRSTLLVSTNTDLPVTTFPQLCSTTTRTLGVVEVCGCSVRYVTCPDIKSIGISVSQNPHRYLATETKAYHPDGERLSRVELLYEAYCQGVALVSYAPVQPAAEYLELLAEDALVLELPFEPLFKLDSEQPLAKRFYIPPSGLPDSIFNRRLHGPATRSSGLPAKIRIVKPVEDSHGAVHFLTTFFRTLFG